MMALENGFGYGGVKQQQRSTTLKQDSVLQDVDDVIVNRTNQQAPQQQVKGSKLQHANEVGRKTAKELQEICEGLNNRIAEFGIVVAGAQQYKGAEKLYNTLGKLGFSWAQKQATVHRHDRLQNLNMDDAIKEISNYVQNVILTLGESESEYKEDLHQYQVDLDQILAKQSAAMPRYLSAQTRREALENEVNQLDEALKAGTVEQADRPAKQKEYEDKKRLLDGTKLEEMTLLAIVKEAKEAIPEIQKSRDAATSAIQAIHSMRQGILEKFGNYEAVLRRATTAMKARARLELYSSVDPAFNKAISAVTENNVATAGAALETWADRAKKAAISPEESQRILQELLGHLDDAFKDLGEIEGNVKGGSAPIPNGLDK